MPSLTRSLRPLVWLLLVAACDSATAPREGLACDLLGGGGPPDDCRDASLWCGPAGICLRRPGIAEVCDPAPCAGELRCHLDKHCGVPRAVGEACFSSSECASGLNCNHGELPELFTVGLCRSPAVEGEPCGFTHAPEDAHEQALAPFYDAIDRGDCQAGLSCAPVFAAPGSGASPPICEGGSKGVACFFAGACRADGTLPWGAACGRSVACASAVCAVFDPPLSAVPQPGFGQRGEWLGPRVGTCIGEGDAIAECGRGDPCAVDFTCLDRQCIAPHTQRPGELCSDVDGLECAFGLACDGRECRYPEAFGP